MSMANKWQAWLPGEPVAQARPKVTRRGHVYYPAKSAGYRKRIARLLRVAWAGQPALAGPCKIGLLFYRVRPKSNKSEWPTVKPDLDNLAKQVVDACTDAGIIRDDGQVCVLNCGKLWAADMTPGVEVIVEPLTDELIQPLAGKE